MVRAHGAAGTGVAPEVTEPVQQVIETGTAMDRMGPGHEHDEGGPRRGPRRATYRLQLHAGFNFSDAAAITGYLAELGVSHVYLSPVLQAAKGSTHGYDVVDPSAVNEELGGEQGHLELQKALGEAGLGQILDVVPNHMAVASRDNRWWWDVLENGPSSVYAGYFDVDWGAPRYATGAGTLSCCCPSWVTITAESSKRAASSWSTVQGHSPCVITTSRYRSRLVALTSWYREQPGTCRGGRTPLSEPKWRASGPPSAGCRHRGLLTAPVCASVTATRRY